jgi:sulfur carrier protein
MGETMGQIQIELNGEPRSVPPRHTLAQLVDALALTGQALALAVNRAVVPRQQWPQRELQPADRVEIVRAIGGG